MRQILRWRGSRKPGGVARSKVTVGRVEEGLEAGEGLVRALSSTPILDESPKSEAPLRVMRLDRYRLP